MAGGAGVDRLRHLKASLLFASKITDACAELSATPRQGRAAALHALLSQVRVGEPNNPNLGNATLTLT